MEKSHTEILQEFRTELQQLKDRIQELENRLAEWDNAEEDLPAEEEAVDFTGVEIGIPDEPQTAPEPAPEPESVAMPEPLAFVPEPPAAETAALPAPLPIDEETARLPWRTDKPGLPVKNIRSGISLLDRALFIGTLFKEDFALYDQTISRLNECASLEEAVQYIKENFPQWNLRSDVVYHFMMAIRKKLG